MAEARTRQWAFAMDFTWTCFAEDEVGPDFTYQDGSEALATMPSVKKVLPLLVVKVDEDGNEVAGVKSPLLMAPLGT